MLIKNSFGELVAEVEPFLSLQKAAKSKSKPGVSTGVVFHVHRCTKSARQIQQEMRRIPGVETLGLLRFEWLTEGNIYGADGGARMMRQNFNTGKRAFSSSSGTPKNLRDSITPSGHPTEIHEQRFALLEYQWRRAWAFLGGAAPELTFDNANLLNR